MHSESCLNIWRHRHPHKQRISHQSDQHLRDLNEEIRPHAPNKHKRNLPRFQDMHPPSPQITQPSHPEPVPTPEHGRQVVRSSLGLYHG